MDPRHGDAPVEVPDGDRIEQSLEVDPEDDSLYSEGLEQRPSSAAAEANPSDVLEQSIEVDLDDEDLP